MSGHSKFANIKHKKEKNDAAKGKVFTKIGREIAVAVKEGGGADPANNSRLRDAIAKAKANNMPNDNIDRSIKKAAGDGDANNYEHIVYEALTAIASDRIKKEGGVYKCYSSSGNKFYTIKCELGELRCMSDDNMAYYRDEVSYPILAVLLIENVIPYNRTSLTHFAGFAWKDVNQKNKNDYMKSVKEFLGGITDETERQNI